ncbi:INO80 complex subunit E isoform X1 [Oncorhynchus mykiss]|uniref:INO80 complex subunit E isoform X1 n=1 Tax=Oncorhynchus mykiss TaxID=8022 RepID=UPI000B4FB22F|nr:INO80 complex subunit E isoform X1 [Oncorhynchus mykiss]XP_021448545.1 INO80 complex subunit E isoform X1 [Oncorhynchus mykiss]
MEVDYKQNYTNLKRKLKFMVYEQECFQEELRRSQKKLLRVSRDKSFLLDRLLQYERVDEDSSDSDATASSENSEGEGERRRKEVGMQHASNTDNISNCTLSITALSPSLPFSLSHYLRTDIALGSPQI